MFQTVRFCDEENTIDAQVVIIDGMIYLFDVLSGTMSHAICQKSVADYGLTLTHFNALIHLKGAVGVIQQYPDAFLTLGSNRHITTYLIEPVYTTQHEN